MSDESNIIMLTKQYLIETNEKILKRHERLTSKQVWIGPKDKKITDELIEKYSELLDELADD